MREENVPYSLVTLSVPTVAQHGSDPSQTADNPPREVHRKLTLAVATAIAQAAIETCKGQGYNVTVTVVDSTGTPKLVLVGDGARPLTLDITRRKAYTSAMQRISTVDFTKRVSTPGAYNEGGLPIMVGEDTIGGIAAAGAPDDTDFACAQAGLDKVSGQLK